MGTKKSAKSWATKEFGDADFGDKRLKSRLINISDRFSDAPENPINQACENWAETKGAYRFFKNDKISASEILKTHVQQTALRAESGKTILVIQDTSYFSWRMPKTKGLGIISRTPGKNVNLIATKGLVMHTCFAVNTDGLPIGILDQKLFARKQLPDELRQKKKRSHNTNVAIEDKESIRWLESLKKTHVAMGCANVRTVTLCDREGDFYEFLECANQLGAHTLVRARGDRSINKISRYSSKDDLHLWSYMQSMPNIGILRVEIPASDQKPARTALLVKRLLKRDSFFV